VYTTHNDLITNDDSKCTVYSNVSISDYIHDPLRLVRRDLLLLNTICLPNYQINSNRLFIAVAYGVNIIYNMAQ